MLQFKTLLGMVLKLHRLILGDLHQVYSGRQDPSEKQVTSPQFLLVEKCILFRFPGSVNSVKYRQGTNLKRDIKALVGCVSCAGTVTPQLNRFPAVTLRHHVPETEIIYYLYDSIKKKKIGG